MRSILGAGAVALCLVGCGGGDGSPEASSEPAARDFAAVEEEAAPVIDEVRLEPREPARDDVVRAVVSARDPNGDSLELDYRWLVDGTPLYHEGATLELDDARKGAVVRVEVMASDGKSHSRTAAAEVRVIDRPPAITALALTPAETVAPGSPVTARAAASDPDGDRVDFEYRWFVNGESTDTDGNVFGSEGLSHGDSVHVEVRASDGTNWTRAKRSAPVHVGSAHPEITSRPPGFREDGVFRYVVEAEDPDGDRRLRYRLDEAPEGMAIDAVLGEVSWRPGEEQKGVHPVKIVVRDSSGLETSQSFQVTVRDGSAEEAPPAAAGR